MGLESYLFHVTFTTPLSEQKAIALLQQAGMRYLPDIREGNSIQEFREHFLELRSKKGLTEVNILLSPETTTVPYFSLRFSVLSPVSVVYQTFEFLQKLNNITPVILSDTELGQHLLWELREGPFGHEQDLTLEIVKELERKSRIPLDAEIFCLNEQKIMKRQTILDNKKGLVIEGGAATTAYIERHGSIQKFWGRVLDKF